MRRNLCAVALLLPMWCQVRARAEDSPCTTRTVLATVIDQQGNPARGFTAANFRGKFRGQPVEILSATRDEAPHHIVILLDISSSMTSPEQSLNTALLTADDLCRLAPEHSSFSLVGFSTVVSGNFTPTENRSALTDALNRLRVRKTKGMRKTALHAAILIALDKVEGMRRGDVICAITDGMDNASAVGGPKVEAALLRAGVRLFLFCIQEPLGARVAAANERAAFQRLAEAGLETGGNLVYLLQTGWKPGDRPNKGREMIRLAATEMYKRISDSYRLEMKVADAVDSSRGWKLEVVGADGKAQKDLEVLYPRQLMPCR